MDRYWVEVDIQLNRRRRRSEKEKGDGHEVLGGRIIEISKAN